MPRYIASRREVKQDYFQWLCELIGVDNVDSSYWILAKDLHAREFITGDIDHDINRAMDGVALREEYIADSPYNSYGSIDGPCTVLEMLVALARRIEFELDDPDVRSRSYVSYFWEMIENLELTAYNDDDYVGLNGQFNVDRIISRFLAREYKRNGEGGLFPLRYTRTDQRGVEIWYQMHAYLKEKYPY